MVSNELGNAFFRDRMSLAASLFIGVCLTVVFNEGSGFVGWLFVGGLLTG